MLPVERADLLLLPDSLSITTLMPLMLAVHGVGGGGLLSSTAVGVELMKRRSHCQPEVQFVVQLRLSWSCRRVVCALALLRLELRISTAGDDVCTPPIGAVALLRDQGCPPRRLWLIARRPTVSRRLHPLPVLQYSPVLQGLSCPTVPVLQASPFSACPSVPRLSPARFKRGVYHHVFRT